jgi:3-deoxy-D-manno-oct-2-ulosonic acid (Kdo) hydroxylase
MAVGAGRAPVTSFGLREWTVAPEEAASAGAATALEAGTVLFLPELRFPVDPHERSVFSPAIAASAKNVSFDPRTGRLRGTSLDGPGAAQLLDVVSRFSTMAARLVGQLLPPYGLRFDVGRTSFRPAEIAGRPSSWRKDDTRLHIDSFPATPVAGRRILRVFTNVNPHGHVRVWRIGEDFESVARRFSGHLRMPIPGSASVLRLLRITKSRRSRYDALMLQLHDRMKADADYQVRAPQTRFEFPAGSTWIAFTDQVSHAAMAGQYQLEQTFLLPVHAMLEEQRSPLRILERLTGRTLA